MKSGKGHAVHWGFLSRGKEDMIVVSFRVSTIAALGCVHFMPFLPLELPSVADIDPKVDGDSRRVYFSQTRYGSIATES